MNEITLLRVPGGPSRVEIEEGMTLAEFAVKYGIVDRTIFVDDEQVSSDDWADFVLDESEEVVASKGTKGN